MHSTHVFHRILIILFFLMVGGCSNDSSNEAPKTDVPLTLESSLEALGVDLTPSARLSNDGLPLPETFSPYGQRIKVTRLPDGEVIIGSPGELVIGGFKLPGNDASITLIENNLDPDVTDPNIIVSVVDVVGWINESKDEERRAATTLRDVAAADIDGNGLDELVIAYTEADQVFLRIITPSNPSIAEINMVVPIPANILPIGDLRLVAGDLDMDGRSELVIGLSGKQALGKTTLSSVLILDDANANFVLLHTLNLESTNQNVTNTLVLEAGNLDYDVASELVVILNELNDGGNSANPNPSQAASRFYILDDAQAGFSEIQMGSLTVADESYVPAQNYVAQVADVAIGDINSDGIGDVIFGGLAEVTRTSLCNSAPGPGSLRYLLFLYEFDGTKLVKTAASYSTDTDTLYDSTLCKNELIRFAYVNILDLDGDRQFEIQMNQFIFDEVPSAGEVWNNAMAYAKLPDDILNPEVINSSDAENLNSVFDRHVASIIASDYNGDGNDDIISFRRTGDDPSVMSKDIRVFGIKPGESEITLLTTLDKDNTGFDPDTDTNQGWNPILVPIDSVFNAGYEVQIMEFTGHEVVWTEPLVLAALAAPPCLIGIGQNTDACTTTWGQSQSTGVEGEFEKSFTAGRTIGYGNSLSGGTPVAQVEVMAFEAKVTLSREAARTESTSYEVTKTVNYTSGPMEDSVVFSSIEYDVYNYEVILSDYNGDSGGDSIPTYQIMLPREPVIRVATAEYYNQHTTEDAVKIDTDVFQHVIGQLDSYPTPAERENILEQRRSQVEAHRTECAGCFQVDPANKPFFDGPFRQFDPLEALPGLSSSTLAVGQGGGVTAVEIEFSKSTGNAASVETSAELEVQLTSIGIISGFAVGGGLSYSTNIITGEGTTYTGAVGSISEENFIAAKYRYGMFTYLQSDPDGSGQEFEVINYWVE